MTDSYPIPKADLIVEEEIKHSRFISFIFHCSSEDAFKCALTNLKTKYPGASHYCHAYILSEPWNDIATGCNDDGEPAGSAGRPMLATLLGSGLGEIGVIVVRYFGGTKLGVGGLVRAYSSGIKQGLPQLETEVKQIRYPGKLVCEYHQLRDVEHALKQFDGVVGEQEFSDKIIVGFALPKRNQQKLNQMLATLSKGALQADFNV